MSMRTSTLAVCTRPNFRRFVPLRFCVAKIWPGTRLRQRLSAAVQCGNAISVLGTCNSLPPLPVQFFLFLFFFVFFCLFVMYVLPFFVYLTPLSFNKNNKNF